MKLMPQRLHLSTAVLLALFAGGWMKLNLTPRRECIVSPVVVENPGGVRVVETFMEFGDQYGFPFDTRGGRLLPGSTPETPRIRLATLSWNVAFNVLAGLASIVVTGLLLEGLFFRRSTAATVPESP